MFSKVQVLIWDFDGTLYKPQQAFLDDIRKAEFQVIRDHTGWSEEKAKEEFNKIFPTITPSGTKTVSIVAHIPLKQAIIETSIHEDYSKYIHHDPELIALFNSLSTYTHYLLVNGSRESVHKGLTLLGVDTSIFKEIVTSEIVGESKPSTKGFLYIIGKTGLPAGNHLMIGDREAVDLVPAKSVGMKTCLVWSETESVVADSTIPAVYDIKSILG